MLTFPNRRNMQLFLIGWVKIILEFHFNCLSSFFFCWNKKKWRINLTNMETGRKQEEVKEKVRCRTKQIEKNIKVGKVQGEKIWGKKTKEKWKRDKEGESKEQTTKSRNWRNINSFCLSKWQWRWGMDKIQNFCDCVAKEEFLGFRGVACYCVADRNVCVCVYTWYMSEK